MNHIVEANKKVGSDHSPDAGNMVERMAQAMKAKRDEMIAKPLQACYQAMAQAAYEVVRGSVEGLTPSAVERMKATVREWERDPRTRGSERMQPRPWYPDDNPNWREHTPGDPMPCHPGEKVRTVSTYDRGTRSSDNPPRQAGVFIWANTVAWRPADEGE